VPISKRRHPFLKDLVRIYADRSQGKFIPIYTLKSSRPKRNTTSTENLLLDTNPTRQLHFLNRLSVLLSRPPPPSDISLQNIGIENHDLAKAIKDRKLEHRNSSSPNEDNVSPKNQSGRR
jgi:hypothetical protein